MRKLIVVLLFIVAVSCHWKKAKEWVEDPRFNHPPFPNWPNYLHVTFDFFQPGIQGLDKGEMWYDWNLRSMRTDFNTHCMLPGTAADNFGCTIILNGKAWLYSNYSDHHTECCQMPLPIKGFYAVKPTFPETCTYNGTSIVRGVASNQWLCPGPNYYDTTQDPPFYPLRWYNPALDMGNIYTLAEYGAQPSWRFRDPPKGECESRCKPPELPPKGDGNIGPHDGESTQYWPDYNPARNSKGHDEL